MMFPFRKSTSTFPKFGNFIPKSVKSLNGVSNSNSYLCMSFKSPLQKYITKICSQDLLFFFKIQWLTESFGAFASSKNSKKLEMFRVHVQNILEAIEVSAVNGVPQEINDPFDPQAAIRQLKIQKKRKKQRRARPNPNLDTSVAWDHGPSREFDSNESQGVILRCSPLKSRSLRRNTSILCSGQMEFAERSIIKEYMKGIRVEFKETMGLFLRSLINNCFALKREKLENRKKMTKSLMLKTNTWLWERKLKKSSFDSCEIPTISKFSQALNEGVLFPFQRDPEKSFHSNLIVRIIYDDSTCFNTKKRVPYRVVCETIDYNEIIKGAQPDYEKDLEFEFIQTRLHFRAVTGSPHNFSGAGMNEEEFDKEFDLPFGKESFQEVEKEEDSEAYNDIYKYKSLEAFVQQKKEEMEDKKPKSILQRINEIAASKSQEKTKAEREAQEDQKTIGSRFMNLKDKLNPFHKKTGKNEGNQSQIESQPQISWASNTPRIDISKNHGQSDRSHENLSPFSNGQRMSFFHSHVEPPLEAEKLVEIPENEASFREEGLNTKRKKRSKSQGRITLSKKTQNESKRGRRNTSSGQTIINSGSPDAIERLMRLLKEIVLNQRKAMVSKRKLFAIRELYKEASQVKLKLIQKEKSKVDWGEILREFSEEKRVLGPWETLWRSRKLKIAESSPYSHFESYEIKSLIMKGGDDLRMEILAMQLIKRFSQIFKGLSSPLFLLPYEIIVLSADSGVLEFVPDSISIDQLKKKYPGKSLRAIYEEIFKRNFHEAQKNFIESLAAYSLLTYLLQIKDRFFY